MSFGTGYNNSGFFLGNNGSGGGGGLTFVSTFNTQTFRFFGDGTIGSPLCGCPIISSCANQGLVVCSDGLFASIPSNISRGFYAQTANSTPITGTTAELSLIDGGQGTLTVPPNSFYVGQSFTANMSGIMSAKNNDNIRIRIKSGSTILAQSDPLVMPAVANQVWNMNIDFTIRTIGSAGIASIATLGNLHILKKASGSQEGFGFSTINNTTFNTTISNTLNITAQWSSTDATNSIFTELFVLTQIF